MLIIFVTGRVFRPLYVRKRPVDVGASVGRVRVLADFWQVAICLVLGVRCATVVTGAVVTVAFYIVQRLPG
jgi:hypothetical protein